jgi:hypothetical protein
MKIAIFVPSLDINLEIAYQALPEITDILFIG